jgi:hypothetical protein
VAASIVSVSVEPGTAAVLTIWRIGVTNSDSVVDITIDPVMAGLSALAFTDGSGDDQGRIDITVPDDATAGSYTWTAEIDSVVVWTGQVFIEQNARNTSYVAHSPDVRSLTDPPFIIYRPEDLAAPDESGLPDGGSTGEVLVKLSDDDGDAGWVAAGGSGDVTAAAVFATDNRLIRSDGAGKGVQASVVSLTDLGALSGITDITLSGTVDGRDVAGDGTNLDNHLVDFGNPHDTTFVLLTDVPADYTGEGGKVVKVKIDETGLEFVNGGAGVDSFVDLDDVPASYSGAALQMLRVKIDETGLEFATVLGTGDVVGPASSTDNALVRFDLTTGKAVQNSVITASDTGVVAGVDDLTLTGSISMTALETVDGRDISVDGTALDALVTAATSTVTANSTFATDNRILRSDGTGRGSQASTVSVTDAGAITGVTDLTITGDLAMSSGKTIDGRDVSADWTASAAHFANVSNPHDTTFILLDDAPTAYTGAANKLVAVTTLEDGLEFVDAPTGDVVGPSGAVDSSVPTFDATGKVLGETPVTINGTTGDMDGVGDLKMSGALTGATDITTTNLTASGTITGISAADVGADATGTAAAAVVAHVGLADPHAQYQKESEKGAASGYPSLNADVHVVEPTLGVTDGISTFTFGALTDTQFLYLDGTTVKTKTGGSGDVVGPASATDEGFARFDLTTGKLLQDGPVKCSDTGTVTGIDDMTIGGSITMSASETVDGRDISVDGAALDALVTVAVQAAATFATDERLLRSDGTSRGAQASTIAVTDAGAVSGITTLSITDNLSMSASKTVDGRDVSADGTALDILVTASATTVSATSTFATDERVLRSDGTGRGSQASTLVLTDAGALSGITDLTLTGDIAMSSGKLVDGVDVSALNTTVIDRTPLVLTTTATWTTGLTTFTAISPASGPTWAGIALVAGATYRLSFYATYQSNATTSSFQFGVDWTNAPTNQHLISVVSTTNTTVQTWGEKMLLTDAAVTDNGGAIGTVGGFYPFSLIGTFTANATPGTFDVVARTRIDSSGETMTVNIGATLILERLT